MATNEQLKIAEKLRLMTDIELIDYYKVAMAYSIQLDPDSPKWDKAHEILGVIREERKRRGITQPAYAERVQPAVKPAPVPAAPPVAAKKKKKKGVVGIVVLVVLLLLVGLTAAAFISGMVTVEDVTAFVEQLGPEKENKLEEVPVPNPQKTETAAPVVEETSSEEAAPSVDVVEINLGETISTDFVEMTFQDITVAEDIKYSVTIDHVTRTTGPDPVSGQKYICLSGTIKNTAKESLPVYDYFLGEFNLGGYIYEVDANDCDILSGTGSPESKMDPMMEYTFRIYTAIPAELAEKYSSAVFTYGFYDMFDNMELARNRSFEEDPISLCPYQFKVKLK